MLACIDSIPYIEHESSELHAGYESGFQRDAWDIFCHNTARRCHRVPFLWIPFHQAPVIENFSGSMYHSMWSSQEVRVRCYIVRFEKKRVTAVRARQLIRLERLKTILMFRETPFILLFILYYIYVTVYMVTHESLTISKICLPVLTCIGFKYIKL